MKKSVFTYLFFALFTLSATAKTTEEIVEVKVNGATRRALVITQEKRSEKSPLVFVFHGRTGTMFGAAERMAIHKYWPEATVVYPQGMWVEKGLFEGFGWVMPTLENEGRDIAFFDRLLQRLFELYNINRERIYAMGHSNGGGFVQALWATRGEVFAAFAQSAAGAGRLGSITNRQTPKPILFIACERDEIVPIKNVQKCIDRALTTNHCRKGKKIDRFTTMHKGENGADVGVRIYNGGHKFYQESLPLITDFFAKHKRAKNYAR
jgi:polyhydroxybutyrate depolymerase